MGDSATKIILEGGNNKDRIGGSSTIIVHTDEKGKVTKVMYDLGALFAPENLPVGSFVANVTKHLGLAADPELKKSVKNHDEIEKIRNFHKSVGGKPDTSLDALFITHMHEDHIGGLVNLLRVGYKFPPIYASKETCAFIKRVCNEEGITNPIDLHSIKPDEPVKINGNFIVTPFAVSHSTVSALGYHTETRYDGKPYVGIMNVGDFHLGKVPLGVGFEKDKFIKFLNGKYVTHIMADSTSASRAADKGPVTYEEAVENYKTVFEQNPNKSIVSPVISRSLQNLAPILEAAKQTGKKVFLDGAMIKLTYDVVQRNGLLKDYENVVYSSHDVTRTDMTNYFSVTPKNKRLIIVSGAFAEGEENPALNKSVDIMKASGAVKMANGMHKNYIVDKDTLVVMGQRAIPVGDTPQKVRIMASKLAGRGAEIVQTEASQENSLGNYPMIRLQRSGHADLNEMTDLVTMVISERQNTQDKLYFLPIHGDSKQLLETAKVGYKAGAEPFICINGDRLGVSDNGVEKEKEGKKEIKQWLAFTECPLDMYRKNTAYQFDIYQEVDTGNGKVKYNLVENLALVVPPASDYERADYSTTLDRKIESYEDLAPSERFHSPNRKTQEKRNKNREKKMRQMEKAKHKRGGFNAFDAFKSKGRDY